MNQQFGDFSSEMWDVWIKKMYLDPFTTILDETQFRVDLFETSDEVIVEINIEDIKPEECFVKKEGKELTIFLFIPGDRNRYRKISFPFELERHSIQAVWEKEWIEIVINKTTSASPSSCLLRFSAP